MSFIHPKSDVAKCSIGDGTKVWQFVVILEGAKIGRNCNICANSLIEGGAVIGNDVTVKSGVSIWDGIIIMDNVFVGPNATFTNDLFPRSKNKPDSYINTIIEEGASIGANATILAGIKIGKYSMIGAGAVVTNDVPEYSIVVGNPARVLKYIKK